MKERGRETAREQCEVKRKNVGEGTSRQTRRRKAETPPQLNKHNH